MAENNPNICSLALGLWPNRKETLATRSRTYLAGRPGGTDLHHPGGGGENLDFSPDGKVYAYGILGAGRVIGATQYLLDGVFSSVAEVSEPTELLVVPVEVFEHALRSNQDFTLAVMKEMAQGMVEIAGKARDLSFLDVQQRLLHSLMTLAGSTASAPKKASSSTWISPRMRSGQWYPPTGRPLPLALASCGPRDSCGKTAATW